MINKTEIIKPTQRNLTQGRLHWLLRQKPVMDRLKEMARITQRMKEASFHVIGHVTGPSNKKTISVSPVNEGNLISVHHEFSDSKDWTDWIDPQENKDIDFVMLDIHSHPPSIAPCWFSRQDFAPVRRDTLDKLSWDVLIDYYPGLTTLGLFQLASVQIKQIRLARLLLLQATEKLDRSALLEYRGYAGKDPIQHYTDMGFRAWDIAMKISDDKEIHYLSMPPHKRSALQEFKIWMSEQEIEGIRDRRSSFKQKEMRPPPLSEDYAAFCERELERFNKIIAAGGKEYEINDPRAEQIEEGHIPFDSDIRGRIQILPPPPGLFTTLFLVKHARENEEEIGEGLAKALSQSIEAAAADGKLEPEFKSIINGRIEYYWSIHNAGIKRAIRNVEAAAGLLFKPELADSYPFLQLGPADVEIKGPNGERFEFYKPETVTKELKKKMLEQKLLFWWQAITKGED